MRTIVHNMAVTTNQSMLKSQDKETQPKYEWKIQRTQENFNYCINQKTIHSDVRRPSKVHA